MHMLPPKKLLENDANVTLASLCLLTEGFHFHFRSQSRDPSASATIKGSGWIRTDRLCFADFWLSGLPQKTITATNYNKHGSYCPSNLYNYSGTSFRALSIGGAGQMYRISGEENVTACFLRSTGLRHPSLSTSLGVPSTLIRLAFSWKTHRFENALESGLKRKHIHIASVCTVQKTMAENIASGCVCSMPSWVQRTSQPSILSFSNVLVWTVEISSKLEPVLEKITPFFQAKVSYVWNLGR